MDDKEKGHDPQIVAFFANAIWEVDRKKADHSAWARRSLHLSSTPWRSAEPLTV
jgi:hypothetical protein